MNAKIFAGTFVGVKRLGNQMYFLMKTSCCLLIFLDVEARIVKIK